MDRRRGEEESNQNLIRFNQLLSFRGLKYSYDEHGRTRSKQTASGTQYYHYDAEHRLIEVRIEQLNHTERYGYVYDALGRRIEKHRLDRDGKPCNRTTFLWDRMQMIQESSADKRQSLYLYTDEGSYEPLARIDRTGNQEKHIYYFHTDLNGMPEELTDEAGEIVWECSYQLWGKPIQEIAHTEIQQNLRYQGQYLDRETGLHYNTFRYYDPDTGRFTQPDPIGLLGGFNLYQYAPNPLMWVDPWGLEYKGCGPSSKGFKRRNTITKRWVNILTGKKPANVEDYLISKGWVREEVKASENAIQHIQFTKKTRSGNTTYILDYHPGGNKNQTNIHGNDYWKIYKKHKGNKLETLGRIGHEGFEKYDRIHNEPVYIDGILMNVE
ncbi:RHS repeat domain-containing protein [Snodgrassella sp. ESL0323]|uniref:RHS repeat domain-containing protein n=1 Tax=Snodgrassella sp. ESL0323 TaxID=2705034 RepID=UPI0019332F02|nr:RHS repeat-associated core domain-containing protein [Snodgrassella sp. ESL0323]